MSLPSFTFAFFSTAKLIHASQWTQIKHLSSRPGVATNAEQKRVFSRPKTRDANLAVKTYMTELIRGCLMPACPQVSDMRKPNCVIFKYMVST
jgi:hypothetical protein